MEIVFDSGITIACDIPQVAAWLKETTKEKEALAFEKFFTIVSETNFQVDAEIFLIAVLACNHILNSYSAILIRLEKPGFTEAEREAEQAKNVSRKAALDDFIQSNQLHLDLIIAAQQPLSTGYTQGSWTLYQNNPLIPIMAIIAKHAVHERTIAMTITPYTEAELNEIQAFVIHNHWKIENLVSEISALIPDLPKRPELKKMLDDVDNDTAPIGVKVSSK